MDEGPVVLCATFLFKLSGCSQSSDSNNSNKKGNMMPFQKGAELYSEATAVQL